MKRALLALALVLVATTGCEDECDKNPLGPGCEQPPPAQETLSLGLQQTNAADLIGVANAMMPFTGSALPARFDLSAEFPLPGDQRNQQSCVGWAVAYGMKSYHERVEMKWSYGSGGTIDANRVFSPAWVYNQINGGVDRGSTFPAALELLRRGGAAPWSYMPYDEYNPFASPSAAAAQAASAYRIASWRQLDATNLVEIKSQVVAGYPVLIGVVVDESFIRLAPGAVWRTRGGRAGRHAMVVVGYDDSRRAFKVMNSWGRQWSDQGYGWIDYDHFLRIYPEAYVTRDMPNSGTPTTTPPPTTTPVDPAERSLITVTNVAHNVPVPNVGYAMRFDGTISIPAGAGSDFQVVVLIYYNDGRGGKGAPTRALVAAHAMPDGQAATGAPRVPLPSGGVQTTWYAFLPYPALDIPRGAPVTLIQTDLVAEPVLFVNGFGVKRSALIPFWVRL